LNQPCTALLLLLLPLLRLRCGALPPAYTATTQAWGHDKVGHAAMLLPPLTTNQHADMHLLMDNS
jgi:hypothetical protein